MCHFPCSLLLRALLPFLLYTSLECHQLTSPAAYKNCILCLCLCNWLGGKTHKWKGGHVCGATTKVKQVQVKSSKLQVKMHVFKIITLTTGLNWDQVLSEQKALLSYVLLLLPDFYRSNPHTLSYLNDCLFPRTPQKDTADQIRSWNQECQR